MVVQIAEPGLYPYSLSYFERGGGAEVEFYASGPGQASQLVGSPSGTLLVYQDADIPTTIVPEGPGFVPGLAGHRVEFRRSSSGVTNLSAAILLLNQSTNTVPAIATDHGVATINYVDDASDGVFTSGNRLIATPPMTAVKSTFSTGAEDNFAMRSGGYLYIPTNGLWHFCVNSDDGFQLRMGLGSPVIGSFPTLRPPTTTTNRVLVTSPGWYAYELIFFEHLAGSEVEFFAFGPGQSTPLLVGDPLGNIQVRQNSAIASVSLKVLNAAPGQIQLLWSTNAAGFALQYTTNLVSPNFWDFVNEVPSASGSNWTVSIPTTNTFRAYRLEHLNN